MMIMIRVIMIMIMMSQVSANNKISRSVELVVVQPQV